MNNELNNIKEQHINSYRLSILDAINNNTNVLVDQDIKSLLKTPPLDSMDMIKSKFLDLAKKNKIVLDTDNLSKMIVSYRKHLLKCCDEIRNIRISKLNSKIDAKNIEKETDTFKINKKDFIDINKTIKKIVKEQLSSGYENYILKNIDNIFSSNINNDQKNKIITDISKYIKGTYQRQLLENFDIKILVKDTTLINIVKEQTERYLFTLNNSRLFNDID